MEANAQPSMQIAGPTLADIQLAEPGEGLRVARQVAYLVARQEPQQVIELPLLDVGREPGDKQRARLVGVAGRRDAVLGRCAVGGGRGVGRGVACGRGVGRRRGVRRRRGRRSAGAPYAAAAGYAA